MDFKVGQSFGEPQVICPVFICSLRKITVVRRARQTFVFSLCQTIPFFAAAAPRICLWELRCNSRRLCCSLRARLFNAKSCSDCKQIYANWMRSWQSSRHAIANPHVID